MVSRMIRRMLKGVMRLGGVQIGRIALRIGQRTALDTALGVAAHAVPGTSERQYTQVFNVTPPVTVYLRASHCRVTVRHTADPKVTLHASLQRSFGIEFATEQDAEGVYIIAHRKPVVGTVARADFTLDVPPETQLALHLTPGAIAFEGINGIAELNTAAFHQTATGTTEGNVTTAG